MTRLKQIGTSRIAITAIAALLATTGAAVAAGGGAGGDRDGSDRSGDRSGNRGGDRGHGPGGPAANKYLTYSEVHTYRRGEETVLRIDAGKVVSVDDDSITLTRRDGVEVTTAIDEDTEIHIPGNEDATTDDLTVGKRVIVGGEQGEPADMIGMPGRQGRR